MRRNRHKERCHAAAGNSGPGGLGAKRDTAPRGSRVSSLLLLSLVADQAVLSAAARPRPLMKWRATTAATMTAPTVAPASTSGSSL